MDARFIAKRYEDYALETIKDISSYFIYLHGVLQNVERQALLKVKDSTLKLTVKLQQSQSSLKKGQETFDEILGSLEEAMSNPPINFTIDKLVEKTNFILETTSCNIEFEGVNNNPFEFKRTKKEPVDFPDLYELRVNTSDFVPRILTYFGDNSSHECSSESSINRSCPKPSTSQRNVGAHRPNQSIPASLKTKLKKKQQSKQKALFGMPPPDTQSRISCESSTMNTSNTSHNIKNSKMLKVHVSHIKNPENFYVQVQKFITALPDFEQFIKDEADYAPSPDYVEQGEMYLVYNAANQKWYRGNILNSSSPDVFKVFLPDYGNSIQVPKQSIRVITETLKSKPNGAIQCSLFGIKCIKNEWNDGANQLMSEIIMNEMVQMVIYKEDTICQVDLITTHLAYPTSVRNALIFADFAIEPHDLSADLQKRVQQLSSVRKSLLAPPNEKFYKNVFKEGESFRGIIVSINDPHDFYAIKYEHKGIIENIYEELNQDYQQPQQKIFTPHVNMTCAVYVDEKWHRAKLTKIISKSKCIVWLVDAGQSHTVPCKQLRALQSKYLTMNECAFQCSLTDIEPHQKNGYKWTDSAIAEFKRVVQNPVLQIIVHCTQNFLHQICVYIIKKDMDMNVNALLVKYKHAISTGPESQYVEYPKLQELAKGDEDFLNEINLMEMTINETKKIPPNARTKVKVLHIVSPGEFYVTKLDDKEAINRFHEEIQLSRSKEDLSPAKPYENVIDDDVDDAGSERESVWKVGNCCLVRQKLREENPMQWYRAVIKEIKLTGLDNEGKYTVFLRDHGNTIENVSAENIAPIPGVFSRVCDGAVKCHMACIRPTGGLSVWSGASIDEFKAAVNVFNELAASIQGTRTDDSIPIVLWGLKQDCPDPLTPTIFKWININRFLCTTGLAHLVEKFHPITEINALTTELQVGEESLDKWLEQLNKAVDQVSKKDGKFTILQREEEPEVFEESAHIDPEDGTEFVCWLPAKEITKTVFMGIPTFVDNNGIIYLYDSAKKQVFDNIITVVNKVVGKTSQSRADSFWYNGQPCLAQYSIDSKFYRAVVLETKIDGMVSVQFVDYGNVQVCSPRDLRKQVILTEIPIQVTKFKLDGVLPLDGKSKFSLDALDFLYATIVNKQCAIRVSANQQNQQIKLCSIKCAGIDVGELMCEAGFAKKPGSSSKNSLLDLFLSPERRVPQKHSHGKSNYYPGDTNLNTGNDHALGKSEITDDEDIVIEMIVDEPNAMHNMDMQELVGRDYQELFEKIDLEKLHDANIESCDGISDISGANAEKTYKPECCSQDLSINLGSDAEDAEDVKQALMGKTAILETTLSSFDIRNTSTSTQLTQNHQPSFAPFKLMTFPKNINKFYCEVTYILETTAIAIYPIIPEHKRHILEMSKNLQVAAALAAGIKTFEPNTPCLAKFSEDNLWYRAMVRSHNPVEHTVDVVFVDFFNAEWVSETQVRVCPNDLIKVPLRNVPAKLAGIVPNRRWRTMDIRRKFSELVEERQVFAKIVDFEGETLLVELYENEESTELLYESLMEERFFLKN